MKKYAMGGMTTTSETTKKPVKTVKTTKKYVPTAKEQKNLDDASKNINMRPPFTPEERKKMKNYSNMGSAKSGTTMKKAKSGFAALAPPYDKATFADRIAGAKKNAGKAKSGTKIKKAMSGYGGAAASMVPMKNGGMHKMPNGKMMKNSAMKSGGKMKKAQGGTPIVKSVQQKINDNNRQINMSNAESSIKKNMAGTAKSGGKMAKCKYGCK